MSADDRVIAALEDRITALDAENEVMLRAQVDKSWDNHFSAFGAQDVDKILLDYTEDSVIRVYNYFNNELTIFEGLSAVRECFTGLFKSMPDLDTLDAPLIEVNSKMVFLVWKCPGVGYQRCTDTFWFDEKGKIGRQNVVVYYDKADAKGKPLPELTLSAPPAQTAGWDNHFSAFGGQDVDKILKDYTEDSVMTIYDETDGSKTVFKGLDGVRECFTGLFKALSDLSTLAAPVVHNEGGATPQVFLIWSCPGCAHKEVTDSFLFDAEGKIVLQNIYVGAR